MYLHTIGRRAAHQYLTAWSRYTWFALLPTACSWTPFLWTPEFFNETIICFAFVPLGRFLTNRIQRIIFKSELSLFFKKEPTYAIDKIRKVRDTCSQCFGHKRFPHDQINLSQVLIAFRLNQTQFILAQIVSFQFAFLKCDFSVPIMNVFQFFQIAR